MQSVVARHAATIQPPKRKAFIMPKFDSSNKELQFYFVEMDAIF